MRRGSGKVKHLLESIQRFLIPIWLSMGQKEVMERPDGLQVEIIDQLNGRITEEPKKPRASGIWERDMNVHHLDDNAVLTTATFYRRNMLPPWRHGPVCSAVHIAEWNRKYKLV